MDFDTPIEDRWNAFMRHVPLTYAAFTKPPTGQRKPVAP